MTTETIKKCLEELDFEPKLKIKTIPLLLRRIVILSDGNGTNYVKNPKFYIINNYVKPSTAMRSQKLIAVMLSSRAVRKRAQVTMPDINMFGEIVVSKDFIKKIESLSFLVEDEFELDAEIVARIGGNLYLQKASLEDRRRVLTMDASSIIEEYGEKFVVESVNI